MKEIHKCECKKCQADGNEKEKLVHHQMNLLLSRMDEQQRRWYVAVEAQRIGHGGMTEMNEITGMHVETIRIGMRELAEDLDGRPKERIRKEGAGRPKTEKKSLKLLSY